MISQSTPIKEKIKFFEKKYGSSFNIFEREIKEEIKEKEDFQKWDDSKLGKGKFIVIHRAIKTEFGSKWDLVPESQFPRLVEYLQHRILNSKLGRIKNSRGEKCFSTWEEWLQKNHGGET